MPKRTYKPLAYVEPPPTADSSDPGKGVWSDISGIAVVYNPQEALRRAVHDALYRLGSAVAETFSLRTLPNETPFDAWTRTRLRLRPPWWEARRLARQILGKAGHESLSEDAMVPRPVIVGTAELHVDKVWRFDPGHQSRDVVRQGILNDFTRNLDRELEDVYAEIGRKRPRPSSRRNLRRDALRYVLREFLQLTDEHIWDCEREGRWMLDDGRTVECPYQKPGDRNWNRTRDQALDAIDHSIRLFAEDAGLSVSPRRRGRPPDLEEDRKLKQERKLGNRRS